MGHDSGVGPASWLALIRPDIFSNLVIMSGPFTGPPNPITISEEMVGHKLGEFAPTRTFKGHTPADKKAAAAPATDKPEGDKK